MHKFVPSEMSGETKYSGEDQKDNLFFLTTTAADKF
jgi:hypothetical protein